MGPTCRNASAKPQQKKSDLLQHFPLLPLLCTFTPTPVLPLKATVGFLVPNELAGLLRGSAQWNSTFDAASGLQRRHAEGKTMCHAPARCVTSASKNAPKGYFWLLPGQSFALGQFGAKQESSLFQVSARWWWSRKEGDFALLPTFPHLILRVYKGDGAFTTEHIDWLLHKDSLSSMNIAMLHMRATKRVFESWACATWKQGVMIPPLLTSFMKRSLDSKSSDLHDYRPELSPSWLLA